MWGGGLLCLGYLTLNLWRGRDPFFLLFRLDPGDGLWFLNWGRNLVYPNEAIYHALSAVCWLAVLRKRWTTAMVAASLLAATHPFSGLQQLLIVTVWFGARLLFQPSRRTGTYCLVSVLVLAGFLTYNLAYLPSFISHRILQEQWTLDWSLYPESIVTGYFPIGILAPCRIWKDRGKLTYKEYFLITCFVISFLLATHDRLSALVQPVQPLHFTRSYVWMPLFLLAVPLLQGSVLRLQRRLQTAGFVLVVGVLFGLGVSDNTAFVLREFLNPGRQGVYVTPARAEMFAWMARRRLDGVVLCESQWSCYASATYTGLRPYLGHPHNTPGAGHRAQQVEQWFAGAGGGLWFDTVDFILIGVQTRPPLLDLTRWEVIAANEELQLFQRRRSQRN